MSDEKGQLPLGFAMALAQNQSAMDNFAKLSDNQKKNYVDMAKNVSSKSEMQELVSRIGNSGSFTM